MGRKLKYRPGSWYITDDRTGFPERAETMRKQWDNQMVAAARWEPRHPQDLVKGVPDHQNVPVARPKPPTQFAGLVPTALAQAAAPRDSVVFVTNTSGMAQGDAIRVMMDNGELHTAVLVLPPATNGGLTLSRAMPLSAAQGNIVLDDGPAPRPGGPITQQGGNQPINTEGGGPIVRE